MKKTRTISENYEALKAVMPQRIREEFDQIEAGKRLPELYYDLPFKKAFHPDLHPDRVTKIFQLIFHQERIVLGSLNAAPPKVSIYSKNTILDQLARMSDDGIFDMEMQRKAQEFITERMDVYVSDLIMLQYSVEKEHKKSEMNFLDIPMTYAVVFMKESPGQFQNNPRFIHYRKNVTDTGVQLADLSRVVYIELDKCLKQVREQRCPPELEELGCFLAFMADVNGDRFSVKGDTPNGNMYQEIREELRIMAKNKKELMSMLTEKYEADIRFSELCQARKEGMQEGMQKGIQKGIRAFVSLCRKLDKSQEETILEINREFLLTPDEAKEAVRNYW